MTDENLLLCPESRHLDSYAAALAKGWSPNNLRPEAAGEELALVRKTPEVVLATMDDEEATGHPVRLPDGTEVRRIPGIRRFIWDQEFCGIVSLRWAKDRGPLPPHVLGHVGYAVVPWKAGRGLATRALAELLEIARDKGLGFVELTTDPNNIASVRVIEKNGGTLVRVFEKPAIYGGGASYLHRIDL